MDIYNVIARGAGCRWCVITLLLYHKLVFPAWRFVLRYFWGKINKMYSVMIFLRVIGIVSGR